jgi:SAM-dependent methyltransferase
MSPTVFDDLADVYEAMIDWPKRLANEAPFFRRWFEQVNARRVVDVACGAGRHAALFHSWGLSVEAADISPQMLERARANEGQREGLHWVLRGFDQPIEPAEPFDAAVCVGNSLALAPDLATVDRAIQRMMTAIRPDGLVIVQVLNLWRLPEGPCQWQKCQRTKLPQGEVLIVKGVHRCGFRGYVDLVVTRLTGGVQLYGESVPFLGLEPSPLEAFAIQAGASQVEFFGGYQQQPYDRPNSIDLVLVAKKRPVSA